MIQWWWLIPAFVAGALIAVGSFFWVIVTDGETDSRSLDDPIKSDR